LRSRLLGGANVRSDRKIVALFGGGRWGRAHASNLSRLLTVHDRVIWVSQHNQSILRSTIAKFSKDGPQFDLRTSLDDGFREHPATALVITAPGNHYAIAQACLRRGVHTFVEKPLSFQTSEARSLIDIATRNNLILAVGLHLLSASYLRHFRSQLVKRAISHIAIRWSDADDEYRYGETKLVDRSTSIIHDVYPHIWSIVRSLTDCTQQKIKNVSMRESGAISIETQAGGVIVEAQCCRGAKARERKIAIRFLDDGSATLDFTQEPGIATLDGILLPSDPLWGTGLTPVMAEVKEFLNQVSLRSRDPEWGPLAENCLDSVAGAEILNDRLTLT